MSIRFKIDKSSLKSVNGFIEKQLTKITEQVGVKTYNQILLGSYPYWSGSYISSWNISSGSPDKTVNAPPKDRSQNVYAVPEIIYRVENVQPYQPIYISNYTPHSYKVEYMGTKYSPHEGWYVATNAVNTISLSYRFS